jgi:hypothetical protein
MASVRRLDMVGNWRFSGALTVPGADVWCGSETSKALILMGAWCGAHMADTTRKKTGMRLRPQVERGVYRADHNGKTVKSCGRERYCLLTGAF